MTTKVLNVRFSFALEADEFSLHSVSPEIKNWITKQKDEGAKIAGCTMIVDPVADATGTGLVKVRTRGPNKSRTTEGNGAAPALSADNALTMRPAAE